MYTNRCHDIFGIEGRKRTLGMHRKGKGFGRGEALKGLWRNEKRDIEKGEKKERYRGKTCVSRADTRGVSKLSSISRGYENSDTSSNRKF